MLNLILIWSALISFVVLFVTISLRVIALRSGQEFELSSSNLYRSAQVFFDHLAFNLVQAVRQILAKAFIMAVNLSHRVLTYGRERVNHAERRFAKVADIVNGKGELPDSGPMSMFLKEIDIRK
jgi:hypothetical protein